MFLQTLFTLLLASGIQLAVAGEPAAVEGEYLIKFKGQVGSAQVANKLAGKLSLKGGFKSLGLYQVALKPYTEAEGKSQLEELKRDPDIEYVEPNYILAKIDPAIDQDIQPLSVEQVYASGSTSYTQSSAATGVASSWGVQEPLSGSNGKVVVAVIDTGLDTTHKVFRSVANGGTGAVWQNTREIASNGLDDDLNGYVDDVQGWNFVANNGVMLDDDGHGTHVSGIVIGAGLDIYASTLDESKILIMPLKFLNSQGVGSTSNAIKAIYYAVNNGAKVINNSWGGSSYSRSLHDALIYAYNQEVVVVSAAGNSARNNDVTATYPANYDVPSNIAVAATESNDRLAWFSNYGRNTVQIGSPGVGIYSTYPSTSTSPNGRFVDLNGTSMAAPLVAGIAALARRETPLLNAYQIKQLLINSSDTSSYLTSYVANARRVNAYEMMVDTQSTPNQKVSQPSYSPVYGQEASFASSSPSGVQAPAGCGTVASINKRTPFDGGAAAVLGLLLIPVILWTWMKRDQSGRGRRRFERFDVTSQVKVMVGDKELIGTMRSLSQGGLSFDAEAALEKGGTVTMCIQSPDGNEMIQVQGQIVWSEQSKSYGVSFAQMQSGTQAMIKQWTDSIKAHQSG